MKTFLKLPMSIRLKIVYNGVMNKVKTYLVGGAVRDHLMNVNSQDSDYVVVGSTPEEMFADGFKQVGADFPVFLHPVTGDEYALARTEKKNGKGYLGFDVSFGPDVTLEEDLERRDLTINAMALDEIGGVIDPFGGLQDLNHYRLRHVSDEGFVEDPVRVLRLARFAARFGPEWTVAPETQMLVKRMGKKGTLDELTPERVWKELSRAMMEPHPRLFFDTLLKCDVLHVLFPEVYKLKMATESYVWHPEGDAYEHTMLVLTQSALFDMTLSQRMGALTHDFGKAHTPRHFMPSHFGHDVKGVAHVKAFFDRLKAPTAMRDVCMTSTRYHMYMHKLNELNPKTLVKMFNDLRAVHHDEPVDHLYAVGVCDERGRLGSENNDIEPLLDLYKYVNAYRSVNAMSVFGNDIPKNGQTVAAALDLARAQAIKRAKD